MKQELPEHLPGRLFRAGQPAPRPVPPPPEALVAALRDELAGSRRRSRLRAVAFAALAAGLVLGGVLLALGQRTSSRPDAAVASLSGLAVLTPQGGKAVALSPGMPVAEGSRVTTLAGGTARVELRSGTELSLSASAELHVERLAAQQRFRLSAGRANVHVKPLAPGQRFVLATEDVEVEVHGTRFEIESTQVDAACDVATATRVSVAEGTVVVRHGADAVTLEAPAQWPDCRSAAAPVLEPEPLPPPEPALAPERPAEPRSARARPVSLTELNTRYREAIAAKRRGDVKAALQLFEAFCRRYPHSQLTEAARVEALRLLAHDDPAAARAAAREYLSLHPRGFARDEANALLAP